MNGGGDYSDGPKGPDARSQSFHSGRGASGGGMGGPIGQVGRSIMEAKK